jgi:iron complex transport system substrate-binding protein
LPLLADRPGWNALPAVRDGRVYVCDGNAYFNRSGPRLVDTLELLAHLIHPARFAEPGWAHHQAPVWGVAGERAEILSAKA